jgi:hypothetical protein
MTRRELARLAEERQAHWKKYRIHALAEGHYQCQHCQTQWSIHRQGFFCYEPGYEYCPNGCNRDVN